MFINEVGQLLELKDAVAFSMICCDLLNTKFDLIESEITDITKRFQFVSNIFKKDLNIQSGIDFKKAANGNELELAKVIIIEVYFFGINY